MITKSIVDSALEAVGRFSLCRFENVYAEIQDGSTFLLISIDSQCLSQEEIDSSLRGPIKKVLNEIVPDHPEQDLGSWMVVFNKNGDVFESIMPT